ncbi:short-chain dehydrogenase/reductase SDR [Naematelia encephala]|uniref:Short-chain dehydrogenase/reductase SDR n=1 Tax=Naematelia encephala TaxID=71784 RepID=A0A1Y2BBD6_9TREE|nr:short-chain dehydrogenase/reductase SDR [Naematelia encephala]
MSDTMTSHGSKQQGIALITGASSGIGRAASGPDTAAIALTSCGWTCILSGRREAELERTAELAAEARNKRYPGDTSRPLCVPGDLTDASNITSLFMTVKTVFGRLDLLFNNAGIGSPKVPLQHLPIESFDQLININIRVPFLCTQEAFRIMTTQSPQGGRIINNGSVSSTTPRPLSAPYTLSKHAISGLTKSTALDGRKYDIACCQIDIGNALSVMSSAKAAGVQQANGNVEEEPTFEVDYAGEAVAYMASLPLHVNVFNQTLMATHMPFVGRG